MRYRHLNRTRFESISLVLFVTALLALSACAKHTGGQIRVPKIPIAQNTAASPAMVAVNASILPFEDRRPSWEGSEEGSVTSPVGEVGVKVSKAATKAFKKRGLLLESVASESQIKGSIVEWKAKLAGGALPVLDSKAALEIEVINKKGETIFRGQYQGTRTSESPIVSVSDIEHSLGIAMSEAVEKMVGDEQLIMVLR